MKDKGKDALHPRRDAGPALSPRSPPSHARVQLPDQEGPPVPLQFEPPFILCRDPH